MTNYKEIIDSLMKMDIGKYKTSVMVTNDIDRELTELEKAIYNDERMPLKTFIAIGDIVIQLETFKHDKLYFSYICLTNLDPITFTSTEKSILLKDKISLMEVDNIYDAINYHDMYIKALNKVNRQELKKHPKINNITIL